MFNREMYICQAFIVSVFEGVIEGSDQRLGRDWRQVMKEVTVLTLTRMLILIVHDGSELRHGIVKLSIYALWNS